MTANHSPDLEGKPVHVLVVLAHPLRDSFSGRAADHLILGLHEAGHTTELADLYSEGFQPTLGPADLVQFEAGQMPDDVLWEQERFERSNALALVFPLWWWSFPAILKGWIDRVFTAGFAYDLSSEVEEPLLAGRPILLLCSTGSSQRTLTSDGYLAAMELLLHTGPVGYLGGDRSHLELFFKARNRLEVTAAAAALRAGYLDRAAELGRTFFGTLDID